MRKLYFIFIVLLIFSCSSSENNEEVVDDSTPSEFTFEYNIHSSLPSEWTTEFYVIMDVLKKLIPSEPKNYFSKLPIYAWNSNTDKPYKDKIGDASGASISGNSEGRYMVLEIPEDEFKFNAMHRYSVIAHEYYHVYQMSLSKNFFDGNIELKWMSEGSAATFESLYIQDKYSYNYFKDAQTSVHSDAINNPSIFEKFNTSGGDKDINYSSSVFMFLVLTKELQKNGMTEAGAFKLAINDFWLKDPTDSNWKVKFEEIFNISVPGFYNILKSYTNDINSVLPSENLKLDSIYKS